MNSYFIHHGVLLTSIHHRSHMNSSSSQVALSSVLCLTSLSLKTFPPTFGLYRLFHFIIYLNQYFLLLILFTPISSRGECPKGFPIPWENGNFCISVGTKDLPNHSDVSFKDRETTRSVSKLTSLMTFLTASSNSSTMPSTASVSRVSMRVREKLQIGNKMENKK